MTNLNGIITKSKNLLSVSKLAAVSALAGAAVLAGGCNSTTSIIQGVTFTPSSDLSSVAVSLEFANSIQTTLSGNYAVGSYGYFFVDPYTPSEPFQIGFSLNTAIFNDQSYVGVTPTSQLPNGLGTGVPYPLVQIAPDSPISSQFNLYGYVDIAHADWLGVAAIFSFINDQYFPNGLSISQVFLRDSAGDPGVLATVFGPVVNSAGVMTQAGGIALFANVQQLISSGAISANKKTTLKPELLPLVSGPRASEYEGRYDKLQAVQSNLIRAFNSQPK